MDQVQKTNTIWFLEDDPADFELVRHQLERAGLPVSLRQITTAEAFRMGLVESPPDVILSDRGLPGFDGFTALDVCRREKPGMPFIFVTGSSGPEAPGLAFERGATDFISKNSLQALVPAVRRALASQQCAGNKPAAVQSRRASLLVQASPQPIVILDTEGRVLDWNPAGERLFGHPALEAAGQDLADLVVPAEHRGRFRMQLARRLKSEAHGHTLRQEFPAQKANGGVFPAEVTLVPLEGEDPPVFAGYFRDISRRRHTETELRKTEEQFRIAVEAVEDYGIFMLDATGHVSTWNAGAERISGFSAEEVMGRHFEMFFTPENREAGIPARELAEAAERGVSRNECWCKRKDESGYLAGWTIQAVRDESDSLTGFALVTHDVTERRRAEAEVARLTAELEERVAKRTAELEAANRELEAFSYSVSHDLRAPLRHISGFAELLLQGDNKLDASGRDFLRVIVESAQRMNKLIDALLSFSRTARSPLHKERMDLRPLVEGVVRDLRYDLIGRNVEWTIGDLPEVEGDAALLRQVFTNLLSNALKYTRPRPVARIDISGRIEENETVIFVRDNGVGFDMRQANKLFGVFQRLHSGSEYEGTGIGLANVRRIIQRHGGRVGAEAQPDAGATFFFALPRNQRP